MSLIQAFIAQQPTEKKTSNSIIYQHVRFTKNIFINCFFFSHCAQAAKCPATTRAVNCVIGNEKIASRQCTFEKKEILFNFIIQTIFFDFLLHIFGARSHGTHSLIHQHLERHWSAKASSLHVEKSERKVETSFFLVYYTIASAATTTSHFIFSKPKIS